MTVIRTRDWIWRIRFFRGVLFWLFACGLVSGLTGIFVFFDISPTVSGQSDSSTSGVASVNLPVVPMVLSFLSLGLVALLRRTRRFARKSEIHLGQDSFLVGHDNLLWPQSYDNVKRVSIYPYRSRYVTHHRHRDPLHGLWVVQVRAQWASVRVYVLEREAKAAEKFLRKAKQAIRH